MLTTTGLLKHFPKGDAVMFGHLTAHEFTQHATVASVADDGADVPLGFTRASEYPTLVAPWMHGVPHQSVEEVSQALLMGRPPRHWAHVYTGNAIPCSAAFSPALPVLPAAPSTPLAKALVGIDGFGLHATGWLLKSVVAADGEAAVAEVAAAVELHQQLMLSEMVRVLRRRLRQLASSGTTALLLQADASGGAAYSQRSPLATPAATVVRDAACAALADPELQSRDERRRREAEAK